MENSASAAKFTKGGSFAFEDGLRARSLASEE
jgi:hypothetical protein